MKRIDKMTEDHWDAVVSGATLLILAGKRRKVVVAPNIMELASEDEEEDGLIDPRFAVRQDM